MDILTSIGSIIILPFVLLFGAISSYISEEANVANNNIIVRSHEDAKKVIDDLIKNGEDVSICNKIKSSEWYGLYKNEASNMCIGSFAKNKKDVSLCGLIKQPNGVDICIEKVAVDTQDVKLCLQISSEISREGCQNRIKGK